MTQHDEKEINVWYRNFLRLIFIRENTASRLPNYRQSFARRVPRIVGGIPVQEVMGLRKLFCDEFRQYSPLVGLIFSHNNFIENLYRFGPENDPAVRLVRNLFTILPGEEICPTHAGHCSGAHLTPALIGDLFVAWEEEKKTIIPSNRDLKTEKVAAKLLYVMTEHPDYQDERERLRMEVNKAEETLDELKRRHAACQHTMDEIKRIQGCVIMKNIHEKRRLTKKLDTVRDGDEREAIEQEIKHLKEEMAAGEKKIFRLRAFVVRGFEIKAARKILRRAREAIDTEKQSLYDLTEILAKSLCRYEVDVIGTENMFLFKYATTAIALAFMWQKYDSALSLLGYFESMARLGALRCPIGSVAEILHPRNGFDVQKSGFGCSFLGQIAASNGWALDDIEQAVITTLGKPGIVKRPPVIPFSYVTWAAYSEFPDCGELALRNLINQLIFNDKKGQQCFDFRVLDELRKMYYPKLNVKLIDFYQRHSNIQEAAGEAAGRDWLDVTYRLNQGRETDDPLIKYRRPREQKNIASPLKNLLRVFNALFGIEPLDFLGGIKEVVHHINVLLNTTLEVDLSRICQDGFGVLMITNGTIRYELQSHKPMHFGFLQTGSGQSGSLERQDFTVFRKLMRYSCAKPRALPGSLSFFEQLVLASLFIPFFFERRKLKAFFRQIPRHYSLLFAELNTFSARQSALVWTGQQREQEQHSSASEICSLIDKISFFEDPPFLLTSSRNKDE